MIALDIDRRTFGIIAAGITTFLNLYSTQAVLPLVASQFEATIPQTTLTVTATLLAVALTAPFVGSVSDMFGRKHLIVGAAFLLVLPTIAAGLSPSLNTLIAWRFLQGLMLPFIFAVTVAYIGDEAEGADAIRMAGTWSAGCIVGGFSGRAVAGFAASLAGWRASFFTIAALTALGGVIITLTLPRETRFRPIRSVRRSVSSFGDHLTNRRLLATYAVGFGVLFSMIATFTYANFLLAAPPFDLGPAQIGLVFVVYLVALPAAPIASRLAIRFGRRPTVAIGVLTIFAGQAITLNQSLWPIMAGLALIAAGTFIEQAIATGFIGVAARHAKSTAVGLYVTCYYIGGALGGILPGGIWHHFGWPGCMALCAIVQLIMLAVVLRYWGESVPGSA